MRRFRLLATTFGLLVLSVPLIGGAEPGDRASASITPNLVSSSVGDYTIRVSNQPNSPDDLTQAIVAVPSGFVLAALPTPVVSGCTSSSTWTATTDLSTITLAAASADDALCDGGTVSVTISVLSAPGDGTYEWTTTVPPPFTVESQPTLVVDGTPPETTISPVPPQVTGGTASFSFNGDDASGSGVSRFECELDGGAFEQCSSPQNYPGLDPGQHTFQVRAFDAAGNPDPTPAEATWIVDLATPVVTLTQHPPLLTNQTTATFGFSSDKSGSTFACQLDGGPTSDCTNPSTAVYDELGDGSHTFTVRATSPLGNTGEAAYTWTVDTVAPESAIISGPPASSNSASAAFTFTSSESGSTFFCSINSSGFAPCTSPQTYSGLGDGTYTFRVQAVDAVGNADPSAATYTWTISGVGPPVADLRPPANVSRLRRSVGYGRLQLRWLKPRDADFDHVGVYVSTSPKTPPRKLLYTGKAQTYTDRHFKNGQYYRYLVVSYDHAKNASGGKPALVRPSALLVAPRPGSTVRTAPTFRWAGVRGAAFYNIQLWKNGEKVLSTWPGKARQVLTRRWRYHGRHYSLSHGVYVWYVWPGFGPRTQARYGQLLGYASFRVR
jgi:hypothetical protein